MSLLEKQEIRDLLRAARSTRNYCMLTGRGRDKSDKLIDAMAPFDGNPNRIKASHLVELRKAMRDICRDIDEYTLTRILDGDSPVRMATRAGKVAKNDDDGVPEDAVGLLENLRARLRSGWPVLWQRAVLPGLAIVLLGLAMHYTHWSFNANLILNRLDDHMAIDVHEEVRDLIVIASAIETNEQNENIPGASTPAQKLFNQTMNRLKAHHYQEESLRMDSAIAASQFDALIAAQQFVKSIPAKLFRPQRPPGPSWPNNDIVLAAAQPDGLSSPNAKTGLVVTTPSMGNFVEAVQQMERENSEQIAMAKDAAAADLTDQMRPQSPDQALGASADDAEIRRLFEIALTGHDGFQNIVGEIAKKTGRNPATNAAGHVVTRLQLLQTAEDLKDKISRANRFALPMIYGSLGAALFCLVRVLTPALSDLGPARAFLRVLFGAFAAMTLSMLFIPANVFTINAQSNPTLIFLACFLFGYSFDAVLSALHRLEAFLQGRLQPQESN